MGGEAKSQREGTDTKAGVALRGLPMPWRQRGKDVGRWKPDQAKPRAKYKGPGTQGVPFKLASGAWNLDKPRSAMSRSGPCALRGTLTKWV